MTRRLPVAVLLLLIAPGTIAAESVEVTEEYTYFTVLPTSVGDLGPALLAAAKRQDLGGATIAETLSRHDWRLEMLSDARECRVDGVQVTLEITYRLPKVVSNDDDVSARWDALYPRILQHEYQHKDIALEASRDIYAALSTLPAASDCDALVENASAVVDRLHANERRRQKQFDNRSNGDGIEGVIRFEVAD